ncbi:MAG: bifunctional demethylmenaquinone methyltransferase/2-methoxy-6-polyprenyl-1,4-benzoquinol methylase UbiE [Phycisphaerales bacterium]|nr:bifunctional demethylmenaquinone methyltransferase/2-methoxy-6-polyprenyl-1,4-benzoquinol methylase UbiE [Phycisphaerales bacterium]
MEETSQRPSTPKSPAWSNQDLRDDPHAVVDKAGRVRAMFGAIAHRYDLNNRLHSFGCDQRWRRAAVAMAEPVAGDAILDVACGTGDLARLFVDADAGSVIGVDFTPEMLAIARSKGGGVEYQQGDAMELAFPDGSVDIVSIAFGLRNVQDPQAAISEFRRVLRPGGRLVILEFSRPRNRVLAALNDLYARHIMPRTAAWIAGDSSGAYRYLPRSVDTFLDPDALATLVRRTGFTQLDQRHLTFGVCTITLAQ